MAKDDPLYLRLYRDELLIHLTRTIGYLGFPARELADHVRELATKHGAKRLSLALIELTTFQGNRVMLNPKARKLAWQLLGVPPERRKAHYEPVVPENRPPDWDVGIVIPEGGPDEIMDLLYTLSASMLEDRLKKARWHASRSKNGDRKEVVAIESELLRRGIDIPPDPEAASARSDEKPTKRARKKAS